MITIKAQITFRRKCFGQNWTSTQGRKLSVSCYHMSKTTWFIWSPPGQSTICLCLKEFLKSLSNSSLQPVRSVHQTKWRTDKKWMNFMHLSAAEWPELTKTRQILQPPDLICGNIQTHSILVNSLHKNLPLHAKVWSFVQSTPNMQSLVEAVCRNSPEKRQVECCEFF